MKTRFFLLAACLMLQGLVALSQTPDTLSPSLDQLMQVPQSPEAAAFQKYGSHPVSLYTGTPDIAVPLHTIKGREMAIPISLIYDASGIKVDQIATWVGLGWNLNAGGMVTRQVRGLPDGYPVAGYRVYDTQVQDFIENMAQSPVLPGLAQDIAQVDDFFHFLEKQQRADVDLQPDIFSFSVHGFSGTILVDYQNQEAFCLNQPDVLVEFDFDPTMPVKEQIDSWTLTNVDGTIYHFATKEYTEHTFESHMSTERVHTYASGWYVSYIASPQRKDLFSFEYTPASPWLHQQPLTQHLSSSVYNLGGGAENACGFAGETEVRAGESRYLIKQPTLTLIRLNTRVAVNFINGPDRLDLAGRKSLDKMQCHTEKNSALLQTIDFHHSYFGNQNSTHENELRLKLDSVRMEKDASLIERYQFEYIEPSSVPDRNSFAVDFWGYYNGKVANTSLIPELTIGGTSLTGADRSPQLSFARIGTLKKIKYPTGGETELTYDLHTLGLNATSTEVAQSLEGATLTGGSDSSNPFGYNDQELIDPAGTSGIVYQQASQLQPKIRFTVSGIPSSGPGMGYEVFVYQSGSGCQLINGQYICASGNEEPYSPLASGSSSYPILYAGTPVHGEELSLSLIDATYRILILNSDPGITVGVSYQWIEEETNVDLQQIGGLRLQKMVDRTLDAQSDMVKYFYYHDLNQEDLNNLSTGTFANTYTSSGLNHQPLNFYEIQKREGCKLDISGNYPIEFECESIHRFSQNRIRSLGPTVAYSTVTELNWSDVEGANGFTVHKFHNEPEFASDLPKLKWKLKNGRQEWSKVYDQQGNLLTETRHSYRIVEDQNTQSSQGLIFRAFGNTLSSHWFIRETIGTQKRFWTRLKCPPPAYVLGPLPPDCDPLASACDFSEVNGYRFSQTLTFKEHRRWLQPLETTTVTYDPSDVSKSLSTTSQTFYEGVGHQLPTRSVVTNSDGEDWETQTYYASDIHQTPSGLFNAQEVSAIEELYQNPGVHRLNQPVLVINKQGGAERLVQKFTFYPLALYTVPYSFMTMDLKTVLPQSIFTSSSLQNSFLEVASYKNYDQDLNLLFGIDAGGRSQSLRYTPYHQVALSLQHSSFATGSSDIAYTSFEELDTYAAVTTQLGGWSLEEVVSNTQSVTGEVGVVLRGANSNPQIVIPNPSGLPVTYTAAVGKLSLELATQGDYTLSFYYKGTPDLQIGGTLTTLPTASEWTLWQKDLLNLGSQTEISIRGTFDNILLDEVRFYPKNGVITTYHYDRYQRLVTVTDVNCRSQFYEYDPAGRLRLVRDQDGNILQRNTYLLRGEN